MVSAIDVQAGELVRPVWQRARLWLAFVGVLLVGGVLLALITPAPGAPLDPSSPSKGGSKALAVLLRQYGTTIVRTTDIAQANGAVLVVSPNDYSPAQLRQIVTQASRLVLVAPDPDVLRGVAPDVRAVDVAESRHVAPACSWPGARAAGAVDFPAQAVRYAGAGVSCYGGAVFIAGHVVVLGSSTLLRNDALTRAGVAALDVNAISDNRALRQVVWLMPGADVHPSRTSIWDLFPSGARRVFWWAIVVGVLLVLWRGRRLGPVVYEPLPVVVRSAEVIEGHGRLYSRAGARDRAAAALREAATTRLGARLGLPKTASTSEVAAAVAAHANQDAATVTRLLTGTPPPDDAALMQLAAQLDELEAAAREPSRTRGRQP
jgi:hypothetical protein